MKAVFSRQVIIGAVATVVVLILIYVFLIAPVGTSISTAQGTLDTARAKEQTLQLELNQLRQAQQSSTDIDARLAKFELLLPKTPDIPTFIRQLQAAADQSNIDLQSIGPSPPVAIGTGTGVDPALAGKGVFSLGVSIAIEGGFFRIQSFIQRLEDLQRVVQITAITLTPMPTASAGPGTLDATLSLTLYILNPSLPLPGATAAPTPSVGGSGPATPAPTTH
ncbi:MAG: type IV pilus inner membrane component PilO [Actinomycetota bacterium]